MKLGQFEEVALFGDLIQRFFMNRAEGLDFVFHILELIAVAAEPAVVVALVDESALFKNQPQLLHSDFMIFIGSSNPAVISDTQPGERLTILGYDFVDMFFHRHTEFSGGAFYADAVLIGPGQEEGVDASLPFESG